MKKTAIALCVCIVLISIFCGCNNNDIDEIYETQTEAVDVEKNIATNTNILMSQIETKEKQSNSVISKSNANKIATELAKFDASKIRRIRSETKSDITINITTKNQNEFTITLNNKGELQRIANKDDKTLYIKN